ncbi:MAG: hypothetical protein RJB39_436 [Candidatus Parcubacteria bacterium]|jgi:molecular chaperone GrpE (heat shock protein)
MKNDKDKDIDDIPKEEASIDLDAETSVDTEDVISEEEAENPAAALKKLRAELKQVKQEKQDMLTGWQKDKADFLNARKRDQDTQADVIRFANQTLIMDMIPTLDGYEQAKAQPTWMSIDETWRGGVEALMSKIYASLQKVGVEAYGAPGDVFDPNLHQAIGNEPTEDPKKDQRLALVMQRGYKLHDRVIRPAMVKVYQA